MVNYNGEFYLEKDTSLPFDNRGFNYGDALFETIKVVHNKILFWEDHYFRLMASMRILRMEIPMLFTMEFLEDQILQTVERNKLKESTARVKLFVYRDSKGLYKPDVNDVGYLVSLKKIDSDFYLLNSDDYVIDLFKDHYVLSGLLSTLKTNNRTLNVIGSIYAQENGWQNCLLLNEKKQIVEALNGNVFLVNGKTLKTPDLESGCIKGVMRKQIIDLIDSLSGYDLIEGSISPFELQQADEIFISNVISGIIAVSKYRKKTFTNTVILDLVGKLNAKIRLS